MQKITLDWLKPFSCIGCKTEILFGSLCDRCETGIYLNSRLLPSPIAGIEKIAPLFYSLGRAHQIYKNWKSNPGLASERLVTRIHPDLHEALLMENFWAIVPVPQNHERAYRFGHRSAESAAHAFSEMLEVPIIRLLALANRIASDTKTANLNQFERQFSENPLRVNPTTKSRMPKAFRGKLLLVDDLITTGATLSRAADTILEKYPVCHISAASLGYRPRRVH